MEKGTPVLTFLGSSSRQRRLIGRCWQQDVGFPANGCDGATNTRASVARVVWLMLVGFLETDEAENPSGTFDTDQGRKLLPGLKTPVSSRETRHELPAGCKSTT